MSIMIWTQTVKLMVLLKDFSVFNLGNFKGGHYYLISGENQIENTAQFSPIHIMLKMAHSSFNKGQFDKIGGQWHHGPFLIELHFFLKFNFEKKKCRRQKFMKNFP